MNEYTDIDQKKSDQVKTNGIIIILDQMPQGDRDSLLSALYDKAINSRDICTILLNNGWDISYDQVRRFRNGSCRIPDHYKLEYR